VSKEASVDQIKEAYRTLSLKYHPKNSSDPKAEDKFAEVSKAYKTIME
jgi:molecular chaperone DnaJ